MTTSPTAEDFKALPAGTLLEFTPRDIATNIGVEKDVTWARHDDRDCYADGESLGWRVGRRRDSGGIWTRPQDLVDAGVPLPGSVEDEPSETPEVDTVTDQGSSHADGVHESETGDHDEETPTGSADAPTDAGDASADDDDTGIGAVLAAMLLAVAEANTAGEDPSDLDDAQRARLAAVEAAVGMLDRIPAASVETTTKRSGAFSEAPKDATTVRRESRTGEVLTIAGFIAGGDR